MAETHHFTTEDRAQFAKKGISEDQVIEQLDCFKRGFPYLTIAGFATTGKGIISVDDVLREQLVDSWREFLKTDTMICKFVPASGAASRMFKDLFEYLDAPQDAARSKFIDDFFYGIDRFAFRESLSESCEKIIGLTLDACLRAGKEREVIDVLLRKGLKYGFLPKGVLEFHRYEDGLTRTPVEEHLVEGALYAKDKSGIVRIHFTVSAEFKEEFEALVGEKALLYEQLLGVQYEVSFSFQKPSTDTVAADSDNRPFRDESGEIVFRPGGHGALIENLNDLSAEIIFIKNIDNVVPDHYKGDTVVYKEVIAGLLVDTRKRVFEYLRLLDESAAADTEVIDRIARFVEKELFIQLPESFFGLTPADRTEFLKLKLNRPIRVCGVVKNSGEPGGGPYWIENNDGTVSLQILESSQIDLGNEDSVRMLKESTHFNPVDLVCSVKSYTGEAFDLRRYVDPKTGFISSKSKSGKELKALELPGLWNGAMADWITLLVEVPSSTFNPVKTVNDLLRKEHQ